MGRGGEGRCGQVGLPSSGFRDFWRRAKEENVGGVSLDLEGIECRAKGYELDPVGLSD